jgi:hypothetical protein
MAFGQGDLPELAWGMRVSGRRLCLGRFGQAEGTAALFGCGCGVRAFRRRRACPLRAACQRDDAIRLVRRERRVFAGGVVWWWMARVLGVRVGSLGRLG